MSVLPTIFRTKVDLDKNLVMGPSDYLPKCGGTYIEKGKFKAFYKSEESYEELFFEEGTVMIPGYYKPKGHEHFIAIPGNHYLESCKYGWNLTSMEPGSIIDCAYYMQETPKSTWTNITKVPRQGIRIWKNPIYRVHANESMILSDAVWVNEETSLMFPKDWYMVVVKGKVSIKGLEREKRTWMNSSKDQEIQIKNLSDKDSLLFLLQ